MNPFNERFNDIVFEKRNKAYGAYLLRKEYPENLRTALFVTHLAFGALLLAGIWLRNDELKLPDLPPPIEVLPSLPPPADPPLPPKDHIKPPVCPPKPPAPPAAPASIAVIQVTDDSIKARENTKPVEPPAAPSATAPSTTPPGNAGDKALTGTSTGNSKKEDDVVLAPDENPSMKGGVGKFVAKHLHYPEAAVERKKQGTVYVSFVVEKDGSVDNIEVVKSVDDALELENEAIRVIKKMKWEPGKAKGYPVRVRFTLPIKFVIP